MATRGAAEIVITPNVAGGVSSSPFTGEQQVYMHPGEWWMIELRLGAMNRADAEEWLGALLGLNGPEGTFLAGDPLGAAPRGTWTGSPLVNGASQTGKTLAIDGMAAGATGKRGDWFQLGSGSSTRLHKLTADFTANGSGEATIDFWPRLRASPANNDPLTIANALGIWRLATRGVPWTLRDVQIGGIVIPGMEVL
ncbi:MAG: hypothetical protein EPO27_10630 [Betaproteobacteria bacterium]|nr:MAG: hypothetical protein EPO27_10630 [Betaproteobacteria bacterium]